MYQLLNVIYIVACYKVELYCLSAYKGFEDIEIETELEIGYPTDVKHVTHIGYDGSTTTNPDKILDHLQPLATTLPLPSVSLKQFKLAIAAQAEGRNL